MNKNFLLFTLIFLLGCFGILGMAEKSSAAVGRDSIFCVRGNANDCRSADVWCEDCIGQDGVRGCYFKDAPFNCSEPNTLCYKNSMSAYEWYCKEQWGTCDCDTSTLAKVADCDDQCCKDWKNDNSYSCSSGSCVKASTDCTSKSGQECLDVTKCKTVSVITNGPRDCPSGLTCCRAGSCVTASTDCTSKSGQECYDISQCSSVSVITNGPRDCPSGLTCCRAGSCVTAAVVPQLPTDNGATVVEPAADGDGAIGLTTKPISKILKDLIKWLLQIVILLAILMLIVSGVMYIISSGDAEKANTAKRAFSYAILGLFVAGLAWAIVKTVVDLLN